MGSLSYTEQVMSVIDPHKLLDGTILCRRDDEEEHFKKSVMHIVPDADSANGASAAAEVDRRRSTLVVLDDREDAWCLRSRPHVLQIPQFRCWHDDSTPWPHPAEADATLFDMLTVLRGLSADLASAAFPSVPAALEHRRRQILAGCVLVFSGGLLSHSHASQPEKNPTWRLAEALGARCEVYFDVERVTHVVSPKPDSSSVQKAHKNGIHAVSPVWLNDSAKRWHRQDEKLYSLKAGQQQQQPGGIGGSGGGGSGGGGSGGGGAQQRAQDACALVTRLLPQDADSSLRMRVAIRYLVSADQIERAMRLMHQIETLQEAGDNSRVGEVVKELSEIVGPQEMQCLVTRLLS